jgi:hypothetical protein
MIDASSSIASGILSGTFGTPAAPANAVLPGSSTDSTSTPAYLLDGSLQGVATSMGQFLSNVEFGEDTQALLLDPLANGKITGTPSANVQKLLSELDPSRPASTDSSTNANDNATASGSTPVSTSTGLPDEGILA